jgi:phenylpyruvate tautomerase PptA (4-oxalocrotonate tautomerase family)
LITNSCVRVDNDRTRFRSIVTFKLRHVAGVLLRSVFMPLVNISIPKGKSPEYVKAIADGVNAAVLATLQGFPRDDRYQIIHELEGNNLEFQKRTQDRVMMYLIMRSGQTPDAKKAFYKKVVENLSRNPGIDPANVLITIVENHDIDWSFQDGVAQFVP